MGRASAGEVAEQLREVLSALRRKMRSEPIDGGLPYPMRLMLRRLEAEGPATTADLARAEQITPQSAGAMVGRLEDEGLVVRRHDPGDARRRVLSLTPAGRKALAMHRAGRATWLAARLEERLDAGERKTLAAAVELLRRIVDE